MHHAPDANEHLIKMPGIAGLRSAPSQPSGKVSTELQAPMPNALMGHHDAAFGEDQFDVPQAETEDMVQLDGVTGRLKDS